MKRLPDNNILNGNLVMPVESYNNLLIDYKKQQKGELEWIQLDIFIMTTELARKRHT